MTPTHNLCAGTHEMLEAALLCLVTNALAYSDVFSRATAKWDIKPG